MNKDFGVYMGLCVQSNDPEMRGRIKIFIPVLAPTINGLKDNSNVDKFFNFIGKESNTDNQELTNVLEELKNILPWAEYAGPICGGNASGRYNASLKQGTTSDSNAWNGDNIVEGVRPSQNYVTQQSQPDAFIVTSGHKNMFVNQYGYQYTPSNYSGLARGLFSIPNVGAHVFVFFLDGDRNFPIYFASSYSQEDIKRIFTISPDINNNNSMDYPTSYENIDGSLNTDKKTFRSKTVLNSNKHTIELIDTDLHEILKFTHYSGSFKEFNNYATIELATNNDQKMVLGDQFKTVKRNKSEYIKGHSELITGGDMYINVGETDQNKVQQILSFHKQIHDYKLLFDIRRTNDLAGLNFSGNPMDISQYQTLEGWLDNPNRQIDLTYSEYGFVECPICHNRPYDPFDSIYGNPSELWLKAQSYEGLTCLESLGIREPVYASSQEHEYYGKFGYYAGDRCPLCNNVDNSIPTPGFSTSSENGSFKLEEYKQQGGKLDQLILNLAPQMFDLEKQLGEGDKIIAISKNKIETIGTVMNDMKSFRVDPIGKLKIDGCWVAPQKTYDTFKPSPHVEYVDVADIPGGDYILTVMNKYKLLVGAKGINIQTHGPLDIYGTIVNFTGEQINISSKNEIMIDGGERFALRARKIALMPFEHNAVVVEGQLHVTRNVIIEGGAMLEGEIGLLHITAPIEWQETTTGIYNIETPCSPIPSIFPSGFGIVTISPDIKSQVVGYLTTITLPTHKHGFKNIPLNLLENDEAVRTYMVDKQINSRTSLSHADDPIINASGCTPQAYYNNAKNKALFHYFAFKVSFLDGNALPPEPTLYYDSGIGWTTVEDTWRSRFTQSRAENNSSLYSSLIQMEPIFPLSLTIPACVITSAEGATLQTSTLTVKYSLRYQNDNKTYKIIITGQLQDNELVGTPTVEISL